MRHLLRAVSLVLLLLLLCSCARQKIYADTFFWGYAYLDTNGNGESDEDDPGIKDATFVVNLRKMGGLSARTGSDGKAMIIVPGGLNKREWPVKAHMTPPPDTSYELVGTAEIVLEYPASSANFLFQNTQ
jgi:hypothetical protein